MLTYTFTNIGSDSLYQHLYKCLKQDILTGKLQVGEKLPSKRAFAKNLGISVITVENAYEQLIIEGYIYSIPKSGFYVKEIRQMEQKPSVNAVLSDTSTPAGSHYFMDFTSNQTPSDLFPFTIWTKIIREILSDQRIQLMTNSPCGGILSLRQAIASYLRAFRGMSVDPEQIIIGAGTEYLYSLLLQLLGNNSIYGVEDPGYPKIGKIYRHHHVPCEYIPFDEDGICVKELEEKQVDVIHISPSHHYPTGMVMPISRRYELLGWAAKKDHRYIIEDDYDSELRLSGKPIPTLQSIDVSEKVIYINTFTKTLSSTMRIGYMVLPPKLATRFYETLSFYSCTVSNFEQYTLARFMESGGFEKHINRLRNYYHTKRNLILEKINNSPLKDYATISGEEAGVHFLMKLTTQKSEEELIRQADEYGIKLSTLSSHYHNHKPENLHMYVMNYSSIDETQIEKCIHLLYKCCTQ